MANVAELPRPRRIAGAAPRLAPLAAGVGLGAVTAVFTLALHGVSALRVAAILVVAVGTVWFATTRRTELALGVWMLYVGLLDAYLKLSTGSSLVTFVRDVLLYAICAGVLVRAVVERRPLRLPPLSGWVFAFVAVVVAQLFNPADGTVYHSLAGVRQELEFVPLFFLTASYVRSKETLRWFLILLLVIGTANGIASWIQFNETPQQLAAWGPGYAARVLGTGNFAFAGRTFYTTGGHEFTRPFGLGTDSGEGGVAGAFALAAPLALLLAYRSRERWRTGLTLGALAGSVIAVYTSEGRAALVASGVCLFAFAMFAFTVRGRRAAAIAVCVGAVLVFLVVQNVVSTNSSTTTRYGGLTATSILATTNNARGKDFAAIPQNLRDFPFGAGLGVAGPAAGVSGAPARAENVNAETELSFLVLDVGIPGAAVLIGLTIYLGLLALRRVRLEPDPETRVMLAAVAAPIAGVLALYTVTALTPSTPVGPYLWAVAGVISYWCSERPAERRAGRALESPRGPTAAAVLS